MSGSSRSSAKNLHQEELLKEKPDLQAIQGFVNKKTQESLKSSRPDQRDVEINHYDTGRITTVEVAMTKKCGK